MVELEEYIQQYYLKHYDEFSEYNSKIQALQSNPESSNWFYRGKLGYVPDSEGNIHYFLIPENMPEEATANVTFGKSEGKTYVDYANCKDVIGITEDLKLYYCESGLNSITGATLANLEKENGSDVVFAEGSSYAKLITGDVTTAVTKASIKSVSSFEINSTSGIKDLSLLYNLVSLQKLTLNGLSLSNLSGIEYLTKINTIEVINCTIGDYSALCKLSSVITKIYLQNITDSELATFCDKTKGIGSADFSKLGYFGIYGSKHFVDGYRYTDCYAGEKYSYFNENLTDISPIYNLSSVTKKAITNLFINNNKISSISKLYEFSNVTVLRLEYNSLKDLNGLYTKDENNKIIGMTGLQYLFANDNELGSADDADLATGLNPGKDGISALADTKNIVDEETGIVTYEFTAICPNLAKLDIRYNASLKWLNYLSKNTKITVFGIDGCGNIDLENGLASISNITENSNVIAYYSTTQSEWITNNSKKIARVEYSGKNVSITTFQNYMKGREDYAMLLDLKGLVLTDDDGNIITNSTTIKYNDVIKGTLKNFSVLQSLGLRNLTYLTDVSFVSSISTLVEVDLEGTGVTDLSAFLSLTKIQAIVVDNDDIKVVGELKEDGTRDITVVEQLFNKFTSDTEANNSRYHLNDLGSYCNGLCLMNVNLLDQLQYTTNLKYFKVNFPRRFSDNTVITIDLSNNTGMNSLTNYSFTFHNPNSNHCLYNFYLPSNIKNIYFGSSGTYGAFYKLKNPTGIHLSILKTSNTDWSCVKEFLLDIPKIDTLSFYAAGIDGNFFKSVYVVNREDGRGLENKEIKKLSILCYAGRQYNTFGNDNISWISNLTTCTSLSLLYLKNCTDFTFLNDMPQMESLSLYNTGLNNIYFVTKMPKLYYLDIRNTEVTSISYDENGNSKSTLDILKAANARENKTIKNEDGSSTLVSQPLKYLYIKGTSLSEDEINNSGIRALTWSTFSY